MDIREKITLSSTDIQEIIGCGRGSVYILLKEAQEKNLFAIKKIGKKFYISADSFWKWFNTNTD